MENYRRETQEIIDKLKKSGVEISAIATHLEVAVSAIYSWLNGSRNIKIKYLKKLRALANGNNAQQFNEPRTSYQSNNSTDILIGHIKQLTNQIADLQRTFGVLEGRVMEKMDSERRTFENRFSEQEIQIASLKKNLELLEDMARAEANAVSATVKAHSEKNKK